MIYFHGSKGLDMIKQNGFTLIEVVIFIIVTSLFATTILATFRIVLLKTPITHQQKIATETARQCMEWFIGQRRLLGYSTLTCPSTPSPSFCTAPTGYTIANNITCTNGTILACITAS